MSEQRDKLVNIQLSNYIRPEVREVAGVDYVTNGSANEFWQYIVDRYKGSPTNAALINSYNERIYGRGLSVVNAKNNATGYAKLINLFPKKEVKKIVFDYYLYGSAVIQVIKDKSSKRLPAKLKHIHRYNVVPGKMNSEGEIKEYFVHDDWRDTMSKEPKKYPAYGTSNATIEILEIKPYTPGKEYFADPSYFAALQYAHLEEEISNFSINHIQNGLSAGWLMVFKDGEPAEEIQENMERKVLNAMTGSNNAARVMLMFVNSGDEAPEIVEIPSNANHEQWQFWCEEARKQILVGHRVTTPMLFGVKDNTGLGNNANEMTEGNKILEKYTTGPFQQAIIEAIEPIMLDAGVVSPLIFLPLEDEEEKREDADMERKPEDEPPTAVEMHLAEKLDEGADKLIECGEDEDLENWECVLDEEVDYILEEVRDYGVKLASTGMAIPNAKSEQDSDKFKIRYQYAPTVTSDNSREFCRKMVAANKIYRKEDIIRMGDIAVNPGWGPHGADTYSIWLYKGGGSCHHKWRRKTYVKKAVAGERPDVDVRSPLAKTVSTDKAREMGDRTRNEREVSMRPKDMPNEGFLTKIRNAWQTYF